MRILIIHRYFWPDTPPYAQMLRIMGENLAEDGHEVFVLSAQPSYGSGRAVPPRQPVTEQLGKLLVRRVCLLPDERRSPGRRLGNTALFALQVVGRVIFGRYDVVMAATTPPVVVAAAAANSSRLVGSKFVYHCQDIHPESGQLAGLIASPWIVEFLRSVDRRTCALAARIVVLSHDMARTIQLRRGIAEAKVGVINNFSLGSERQNLKKSEPAPPLFRVVFAGNIGHFQGLEAVIDSVATLGDIPEFELLLVGDGAQKDAILERAGPLLGSRVRYLPFQSQEAVENLISDSQLGLVVLRRGVYKVAYPSKTASYLKVGCPLLVCVERESELAELTEKENLGFVVSEPDNPASIAEAIRKAYRERREFEGRRSHIVEVGRRLFGPDRALGEWSRLFSELMPD